MLGSKPLTAAQAVHVAWRHPQDWGSVRGCLTQTTRLILWSRLNTIIRDMKSANCVNDLWRVGKAERFAASPSFARTCSRAAGLLRFMLDQGMPVSAIEVEVNNGWAGV
jgi:hypothetical protein